MGFDGKGKIKIWKLKSLYKIYQQYHNVEQIIINLKF
jgi:hypothetical protein